jgi:hypothetical protein
MKYPTQRDDLTALQNVVASSFDGSICGIVEF